MMMTMLAGSSVMTQDPIDGTLVYKKPYSTYLDINIVITIALLPRDWDRDRENEASVYSLLSVFSSLPLFAAFFSAVFFAVFMPPDYHYLTSLSLPPSYHV